MIVDASADLDEAAERIARSKCFDNATSCSSENSVVILDDVYDEALAALERAGGYLANAAEKEAIRGTLWVNGKLNRAVIAKDARVFAAACGLGGRAPDAKFFLVEESGVGRAHPFSDEKLALVLTVYRAASFDDALERVARDSRVQREGALRRHPTGRWRTPGGSPRSSTPRGSS